MKSLHKTFDILEFVFLMNGEKVTPSEVAQVTGLNLATCTRIMGELVARGYLEKVSRKEGYLPGSMIAALSLRKNPYERLTRAAEQPVRNLAERIGMPVNLSVSTHAMNRVMLFYHCTIPGWKPWNSLTFNDHLGTPTERLLLAAQPEDQIIKLMKDVRFPLSNWKEVNSLENLLKELRKIRRNGTVCFQDTESIMVMGALIEAPGYPAAAMGFGIRDAAEKNEIQERTRQTAKEIVSKLCTNSKAY